MPKLSIIIPTFNSGTIALNAINSILTQTYSDFEILIIDGASKDNTLALISSLNDNRINIFSNKDDGIYDAMNRGIEKATGEWLYFLGSDDKLYDNNVLTYMSKHFDNNLDMIYGDVKLKSSGQRYLGKFDLYRLLIHRRNICHQAIFYNVKIFKQLGLYNIDYKILADYEMNLRIFARKDCKAMYVDRIIAVYNENGVSSNKIDLLFQRDLVEKYVLKKFSAEEIYYMMIKLRREVENFESLSLYKLVKMKFKKFLGNKL